MTEDGGRGLDAARARARERLDRAATDRIRSDPEEKDRYDACRRLIPAARTEAGIKEALALFTLPPAQRQRMLIRAFEEMGRAAEKAGVTPEEVEEELAAWKRERSTRLRAR